MMYQARLIVDDIGNTTVLGLYATVQEAHNAVASELDRRGLVWARNKHQQYHCPDSLPGDLIYAVISETKELEPLSIYQRQQHGEPGEDN